jgi:hypothetical protein
MPIKIPKSFARRKSSGSALEEVQNAPAPSFKVFERPPAGNRSWDGTNALKKPSQVHIYGATENDNAGELFHVNKDDSRNRYAKSRWYTGIIKTKLTFSRSGSGGTNNSASTAPYGSAASSARFSSSSTIPSSTDISNESHANSMVSAQRPFQDIPVPSAQRSRGWSIKNAGRTFSFATKQKNEAPVESLPPPRPSPTIIQETNFTPGRRERAMTASTASTATPSRLLDGDLAFGDSDLDNFGNMFDSFGRRSNRASAKVVNSTTCCFMCDTNDLQDLPPLPDSASEAPASQISSPLPPPLDIHRTREAASSPYSWASHDSRDGLMGSPSPTRFQSATSPSPPVRRKALPTSEDMPASQAPLSPVRGTGPYARGQTEPLTKSPSPVEDEGAGLLANSIRRDSSQQNTYFDARRKFEPVRPNLVKEDDLDNDELLYSTQSPNHPKISRTGPSKAKPSGYIRQPTTDGIDLSLVDSVRAGAQSEANAPAEEKPGEIGYHTNEEETAKQRGKQEADLRTNRQTMMGVTGESFSGPSSNNAGESGRLSSMSSPELSRMSHLTVNTGVSSHSGKSSGTDEEDEDVPLGILAAHGFPNKNKPPGRLHPSLVHANLRSSGPLSAPPASVSGDSRAGSRGNLPVFARNLPQDPYNGASLGPPNRGQLLSMGGQSFGGVPPGQIHPSGLVGVIAGEERARAMRRGSPNQQGNHENVMAGQRPGMMARSQTMGNMSAMNGYPSPGMPGMMYPQALSPGDQAQIQMAQQMNQMMQIQMQFMQQMSQWQQNGQMGQMPQPGMMGMPGEMNNPNQRPFSMPLLESSQHNGRAMSLTPGTTSQWNRNSSYAPSMAGGQGGYAPSIAPSERNTIGMASRYRPVSIAESNKPTNDRASTFTSGAYQRWTQNNEQGRLSPSNTNTTVRPTSTSALGQKPVRADDEDDDQGWADMKKKRDRKKGMWRLKRSEKSAG